ncbi:MAG: alpha-amylase [Melioribacteraceae bacterium]|nr:MAG: alpha-amylase [Melioribacteraceae bacterium]
MKSKIFFLIILAGFLMAQPNENFTPDWARKAIWYQIFPERFRNGDNNNNPVLADIKNSYPHDNESPWQVHPWNSDWYKLQPLEKETGKDIWFNLQRRRYGGDLQGIIDKLDYIQELGVTALYLNPVFQSPSLHKYDGATYHHVDPNFGPDPEGDKKLIAKEKLNDPSTWVWTSADKLFLHLVKEIHKRDMRIIIDGVFNHMGLNSPAFIDVQKNQEKSEYADWFKIISFKTDTTEFEYSGWYGVRELPELNQDENGITEKPKKYIFDITKRWMDPNGDGSLEDGIDGWRLDVAFMVKHNFWKDWRTQVKNVNPEAYITAEIIETVDYNKPYLEGDEFDAVMNYNFAFASEEFFINKGDKTITAKEFDKKLRDLRNAYPECVAYVQQNLYDSHDTNRLLSHIKNPDVGRYRDWGNYYNQSRGTNPEYNTTAPGEREFQIQKLMVLFQMAYLGAPMVYYGDEIGMWGANDPCCRKPMIWDDITYEDEIYNPDQTTHTPDEVKQNPEIFNWYKKLISIRKDNLPLQLGDFNTIYAEEDGIYIFTRTYQGETILVAINNNDDEKEITNNIFTGKMKDLILGEKIVFEGSLNIPAKSGKIFAL